MAKKRYTEEFKQNALELVQELGSFAEASKQLGISDGVVRSWAKKYDFQLGSSGAVNKANQEAAEELKRLRKENQGLKKVNNILSRAAAFFSQDHLK